MKTNMNKFLSGGSLADKTGKFCSRLRGQRKLVSMSATGSQSEKEEEDLEPSNISPLSQQFSEAQPIST